MFSGTSPAALGGAAGSAAAAGGSLPPAKPRLWGAVASRLVLALGKPIAWPVLAGLGPPNAVGGRPAPPGPIARTFHRWPRPAAEPAWGLRAGAGGARSSSWALPLALCRVTGTRSGSFPGGGSGADPPVSPLGVLQPPPPGCPPNAAQLAVMQGANVLVTQRKGNFFLGGSDGGYTIW